MPVKKTTEQFITEAKEIYGDKYDYSKVKYNSSNHKVTIICPEHGEFQKTPQKHLIGQGCRVCRGYIALTQESFIERAQKTHGNLYDYSKSVVKSKKDKVSIICEQHGLFEQLPSNHIKGHGCPKCGQLSRAARQSYSKEDFIKSVCSIHQNKYNYSAVKYKNSQTKIEIICPLHGSFMMKPNSHFNGQGCPTCGRISAKENIALDYSVFLERAEKIHQNRYEYLENSYINYTMKMKMFCSEHGFFTQTPHSHISMRTGCPHCGIIQRAKSNQKEWNGVHNLFLDVHGGRYNYDESSYIDVSTKMKIKCNTHGWFMQKPYQHYGGSGCNKCAIEEVHEKQKIDFDEFKKRSILIHGSRYKYFEDEYIDIFTPVKISCDKHGEFYQKPRDHYRGSGCSKCLSSRGENTIRLILQELKIDFEEQKTFDDLIYKRRLKCDFFLPNENIVIEYNGLQHYDPIPIFGGLKGLKEGQKRDLIKYKYLSENNIILIIVRYDNTDIKSYLKNKLNIVKSN